MYELDKYQPSPAHRLTRPDGSYSYQPVADVGALSLLFWGEHCIECAAPACFKTCDLYEARLDGRCRRFTWGIARNRAFSSLRGYGVEVSFKKWGKLEARGNTKMVSRGRLLTYERLLGGVAPALTKIGATLARIDRKRSWRELTIHAFEKL